MREALEVREVEFPIAPATPRVMARPPEYGALSPADAHPAIVARPDDEVRNGFTGQQLRLSVGQKEIEVSASQGPDPSFPFAHPVLVISCDDLESVRSFGVDFLPAVALAADRQWLDRMVVVRDGPRGRQLAAAGSARYALVWSVTGMQVLDVQAAEVVNRFAVRAREIVHRCCPLIADARPGDRCRMYGGGGVQRAVIAAGYWLDRRYLFVSELGCDEACGEPTARPEARVPTRYRTWMSEADIDQAWTKIIGISGAQADLE